VERCKLATCCLIICGIGAAEVGSEEHRLPMLVALRRLHSGYLARLLTAIVLVSQHNFLSIGSQRPLYVGHRQ
jgi:hypothetical protein